MRWSTRLHPAAPSAAHERSNNAAPATANDRAVPTHRNDAELLHKATGPRAMSRSFEAAPVPLDGVL